MEIVFFLAAGKVLVHLVQNLPAALRMSVKWLDGWFIDLFHCDLCLGVWIYFILCSFFRVEITSWAGLGYVPLVSEGITAAVFSWLVHMISIGFKFKYGEFTA
jgi:hypothetical protein